MRWEYTLEETPVHTFSYLFTLVMFLGGMRKPEEQEEIQKDLRRRRKSEFKIEAEILKM